MTILYLTCANDAEAQKISNELLTQKLIACARRSAVSSSYWWDDEIQHSEEILLMMETVEEKFGAIEAIVTKLHSYDEYVLTAVNVERTTPGVSAWLEQVLN